MPDTLRHVLTIGLLLTAVGAIAAPAAAQSGPWRPEQTIGIAVGVSDDGNWAGDGRNLLVSGTYELPIADLARVRFEVGRTRQAIFAQARSPEGDTAHISRLTVNLAAIKRSAAPLMPYGGVGIGLYHATFNRAPSTGWRRGGYLHAGIEVQVTDAWLLPLAGGSPRQLTHFTDGPTIGDFAWSRDGKRIAVSRSTVTNDIVLFKGLR